MPTPIIEFRRIGFSYEGGPWVLDGLDLSLNEGERVGLAGPNGSGKTTLLRVAVGLLKPESGELWAFGSVRRTESQFYEVRCRAGLLFQDSDDQLFCPTVLDDVAFGPLNLGRDAGEAVEIASEKLSAVGLQGFETRITYKLSAGEKRLVALAGVLAMEPDALLLDEPTAGLDDAHQARLLEVLSGLPQAMLVVSHDHSFLDQLVERTVQLEGGRIVSQSMHET
jgi:cobalt/nickel transport system ATP-binding protein